MDSLLPVSKSWCDVLGVIRRSSFVYQSPSAFIRSEGGEGGRREERGKRGSRERKRGRTGKCWRLGLWLLLSFLPFCIIFLLLSLSFFISVFLRFSLFTPLLKLHPSLSSSTTSISLCLFHNWSSWAEAIITFQPSIKHSQLWSISTLTPLHWT